MATMSVEGGWRHPADDEISETMTGMADRDRARRASSRRVGPYSPQWTPTRAAHALAAGVHVGSPDPAGHPAPVSKDEADSETESEAVFDLVERLVEVGHAGDEPAAPGEAQ